MVLPELEIEDHLVVEKSYPDFWRHLEIAGVGVGS
jgi:5-enolpyruvylshikimate-3-phosphate synthase